MSQSDTRTEPKRTLAALWIALAAVPTIALLSFTGELVRPFSEDRELPSPIAIVFLLGLFSLAGVFWTLTFDSLRGIERRLPASLLRITAMFLAAWSLCTAFMALDSQVYLGFLWTVFGLATSISMFLKARAGQVPSSTKTS